MKQPTFENPWGDAEFQAKFCKDFQDAYSQKLLKTFPLSPFYDKKAAEESKERFRTSGGAIPNGDKYWWKNE